MNIMNVIFRINCEEKLYFETIMEEVFKSFCAFGAADKSSTAAQMDGAKFAKLFRDLKLLDKHLTSTDVDIAFSKVKPKTE